MKPVPMKVVKRFNFSLPPHEMTEELTPESKQFVIYHLGIPDLRADNWTLSISGLVKCPLELNIERLQEFPTVTLKAFHECVGNPLNPTVPVRRVNQLEWAGVPLRALLDKAEVKSSARYLWASGADRGVYEFTGVRVDEYKKYIPIDRALEGDVLLATHLNGKRLPETRGGPVRLIVPGYYGTNSVKWVTKIEVRATRCPAYFSNILYNDTVVENGRKRRRPVWKVAPHSIIVSHAPDATTPATTHKVWGWAWGDCEITEVEFSSDNGMSWSPARVECRSGREWQRFELEWKPDSPGEHILACRAIDSEGNSQPDSGARNEVFKLRVVACESASDC